MAVLQFFAYQPHRSNVKIPLFTMSVAAGVPIPVEHDIDQEVDLNEFIVEHPAATFFARVWGGNMSQFGVGDGDVLVVDTAVEPSDGKMVVVTINNDLSVRYFREIGGEMYLQSADKSFVPLKIGDVEFAMIGVVTKVIHSL